MKVFTSAGNSHVARMAAIDADLDTAKQAIHGGEGISQEHGHAQFYTLNGELVQLVLWPLTDPRPTAAYQIDEHGGISSFSLIFYDDIKKGAAEHSWQYCAAKVLRINGKVEAIHIRRTEDGSELIITGDQPHEILRLAEFLAPEDPALKTGQTPVRG